MDRVETYRQIVRSVLKPYTQITYANVDATNHAVFDPETDNYIVVSVGWGKKKRVHGCLVHIAIIEGKVWIQRDGTEDGIANELVEAGMSKEDIVLGFHEPIVRPHTGFGVA